MQIMVRDNNVDQALRALKNVRRARKMERKQQERDGAK